ncbi:MAG: sensor histidine kinase [Inquilinaceae bacterium]
MSTSDFHAPPGDPSDGILERLVRNLADEPDIATALLKGRPNALDLVAADGVAVVADRQVHPLGRTPPRDIVQSRAKTLAPAASGGQAQILGDMLAVPLPRGPGDWILWFRDAETRSPPAWTERDSRAASGLRLAIVEQALTQTRAMLARVTAERDAVRYGASHRVKNMLQVVSSLLVLQSRAAIGAGVDDTRLFDDAVSRVVAIARVHELRYDAAVSGDAVAFDALLGDLCADLAEAAGRPRGAVTVRAEPTTLPTDTAVALALIVHETVTNALRHAYPASDGDGGCGDGSGPGSIVVGCAPADDGGAVLTVVDGGVGLPPGFDAARADRFGLTLASGMARQIDADLTVRPADPGVEIRVAVPGAG